MPGHGEWRHAADKTITLEGHLFRNAPVLQEKEVACIWLLKTLPTTPQTRPTLTTLDQELEYWSPTHNSGAMDQKQSQRACTSQNLSNTQVTLGSLGLAHPKGVVSFLSKRLFRVPTITIPSVLQSVIYVCSHHPEPGLLAPHHNVHTHTYSLPFCWYVGLPARLEFWISSSFQLCLFCLFVLSK